MRRSLIERERSCWALSRPSPGRVRFQRIAPPLADDEGRLRPDFALHLRRPTILAKNGDDGTPMPVDDLGRLHIRAYAVNPEEIVQSYGIRISWDAFSDTMHLFRERPRMLAHHFMFSPIGNWPEQEISREGLTLGGWISSGARNTAWGDMQRLTLDGVLDVSVSFFIDESEFDEEGGFLQVTKATLFEASLVSIPAMWSSFLEVAASWAKDGAVSERDAAHSWSAERWLRTLPDLPADPPRVERRQDRPSPELVAYSQGYGADVAEALRLARTFRGRLGLGSVA